MITPRILKGFRDFLPGQMLAKKDLISRLESVFTGFGFVPIDTPTLEYTEILLGKGGGETDKQMYRFNDNGGRDVALRFDLTVPLARYISQHHDALTFPFKRYHIAPVFRGEKSQRGRFREFYQCDFDILGEESITADLEILLVIQAGLAAINAGDFTIHVNNRGILNALLSKMGVVDQAVPVLRAIDKIYKAGEEGVRKDLLENTTLNGEQVDSIVTTLVNRDRDENIAPLRGQEIAKGLAVIRDLLGDEYSAPVDDLSRVFNTLDETGLLDAFAYNPVITRGLDYYTGIVFESFFNEHVGYGSVCSGGRYDNLTALYSKKPVSGVGASFGLDRILALMLDNGMLELRSSSADCMIFNLDDELFPQYLVLANRLRNMGINCEVALKRKKIGAQFKLAEKRGLTWVIIAGEDELSAERWNIKNIETGEEWQGADPAKLMELLKESNAS
jgi:histidyl-tRNA synthetase